MTFFIVNVLIPNGWLVLHLLKLEYFLSGGCLFSNGGILNLPQLRRSYSRSSGYTMENEITIQILIFCLDYLGYNTSKDKLTIQVYFYIEVFQK